MLARKIAFIDLTRKKVKIASVPLKLRIKFLGGRGLNIYYLYRAILLNRLHRIQPFSPRNPLIVGTGFLTGTLAPCSSRFNITAISPESGILGDSNCGGFFGPELKYAGFETLVITGKARKPVYIWICDGNIELRDASPYWGLDTIESQKSIRADTGDCELLVIGQAGENLIRFACVRSGLKNAAGRCGLGAVMGSKFLKAIAAYGTKDIQVSAPEKFLNLTERLKNYIHTSKITPILGTYGTPLLYEVSNAIGAIRTKNSQLNAWSDTLNAEFIHKYVKKMLACSSCVVHCRHRNTLGGEGPEYTAVGLLGANLGFEKPVEVIELSNLCNKYGLDISSTGTIIAWAYELYEKGVIDKKITGEKLEFGNFEVTKKLISDIAVREGFGNVLAESVHAVKQFGVKAKDYLIAVKNLPQSDPHDVRYLKAFALGIATASRGGDHLRSRPTLEIFFKLPHEVKERIYGKGISPEPTSLVGKEKTVYFSENIFAVIDSLGLCKFICHGFNSPHFLDYSHFADLIYYSAGLKCDAKNLVQIGIRIVDLERTVNMMRGVTSADDTLPKRYFEEPMVLKAAKGHYVDRVEFANALKRYYKLRGWSKKGMVKSKRQKEFEALARL